MPTVTRYLCGFALCWTATIHASDTDDFARLLQGEVLFESLRDHKLDALLKLNTGLSQHIEYDSVSQKKNEQPLNISSTIELQLAFGLSQLTNTTTIAQFDKDNHKQLRNHDAYQLAQFYYKNHKPVDVIRILNMIQDDTNNHIRPELEYLRALAYIRVGKFSAATIILENLPDFDGSKAYIMYNQGIALLQSGDEEKGISILSLLGEVETSDFEILALKDKANLKLGYRFLETGKPEQAKRYFKRIRLEGPFTSQALLGSGWASFSLGQIERAIVPWTLLHDKTTVNDSVVEAKMALPYAYAKVGAHGKAANLYGHAIELFESELSSLNASIETIRNGELTQIILDEFDIQDKNWFINLLRRSRKQQQDYLPLLTTSDQFLKLAEELHDLALIKNRLEQLRTSITSYNEFVELKRKNYASIMPEAEKEILKIYGQMKKIVANDDQQSAIQDIPQNTDTEITKLKHTYSDYLKTREAEAKHHQQLAGLVRQLPEFSTQVKLLSNKLRKIIARTDKQIQLVAIDTLEQKRKRLQSYRANALFALAESYDFATRKQQ